MKIKVGYFASLREAAARDEEELDTQAATVADLYHELQARYGFALKSAHVAYAVNESFSKPEAKLKPGDFVVFIPPIAGG